MGEYYEYYRSGKHGFLVRRGNLTFPPHFHQNIEICILLSGEQELCISGKTVHAVAPSVTVIDNFAVHSYGEGDGEKLALIIPHDMINEFNQLRCGKSFGEIYIQGQLLTQTIADFVNNYLQNEDNYYRMFSALNMIMSLLSSHLPLVESKSKGEGELINKILTYAQQNFRENISLRAAARSLGYAEEHLSRVFHKYVNEGFPFYVNRLRYEYVQNRLETGENITKLIFDAGFRSAQTYYRIKHRLSGQGNE